MIHCIGDSHSSVFSGNEEMQPIWPVRSNDITPYFKSYRIGPATAYQLENKKNIINQIIPNVKDGDHLLFCFGEVDIRAHLLKQSLEQNKDIEIIIDECLEKYIRVVKHYKEIGYDTIIWGPIASWNDEKPYNGGPSYGTSSQRNSITKSFNDKVKKLAISNDIKFVTIFDKMLNEDGSTNSIYLDDWKDCHIHLNQKSMELILEAFKNQGLI